MRTRIHQCLYLMLVVLLAAWACAEEPSRGVSSQTVLRLRRSAPAFDPEVARVNDIVITKADVERLLQTEGGPSTASEALDELIRDALLAHEAIRRGFGGDREALLSYRDALALAWMKHAGENIREADLDDAELQKGYESRKEKYWHGVQRRMIHALVSTDKKGLESTAARGIAQKIAEAVSTVASEDEFRLVARKTAEELDVAGRVRVENLPPFDREYKKFVSPFVEKAFEIPSPGKVSKPFETSFGWHVVYFIEELPETRISFEEARAELATELLARERKRTVDGQIEAIYKKARVRLMDTHPSFEEKSGD